MRTFRWPLITCALGALVGGSTFAEEIKLPPISGELSGDFRSMKAASAPALHWTATVRPDEGASERKVVEASLQGEGARLRALLNLKTLEEGSWQISDGEFDLARWFPALTEMTGDAMTGIVAKGTARISGSGVVHAGVPSGTVKVVISDGQLASATGGWTLDGAAFTGEFFYEGNGFRVKSVTPFDLTVGTISTGRFGARAFSAQGVLNEDGRVALSGARVEIAGGRVTLDPTTMSLAPLAVEATLNVIDVGMQDIAALVPAGLSAAQGRIDGIVRVGWSTARGFHVGAGNLTLGESEPATVRLAPTPGFLTRTMPKRFEPVPAWTGPLSRWLSADNPIYRDMAEIELGRTPLRVESLSVRLTPEGDALGRTATVRMVARPLQPDAAVKVVNIDVNVAGPLDSILHLGLNQKFSIETHP